MAKKKNSSTPAINWIKLGNVSSSSADLQKFVNNWIEHNEEIQILKRFTVETSSLTPPRMAATDVHTFVVKWRKALQQYKGKWQWRDVESYLYIEKTPIASATATKSVDKVATVTNPPKQSKLTAASVQGAPKQEPIEKSVMVTIEAVPPTTGVAGQASAPQPRTVAEPEQPKRDKSRPNHQNSHHVAKQVVSSSRKDHEKRAEKVKGAHPESHHVAHQEQSHSATPNKTVKQRAQSAAYTEHHAPVILDGLATKQQGIYSRRHLGMKITKSN